MKKKKINKFLKLYDNYESHSEDIKKSLNDLNKKVLGLVKDEKILKKIKKEGLKILMDIGIKEEEYEICSDIKKEIDKRNE
jgi:cell division protein FtsL